MSNENIGENEDLKLDDDDADKIIGGTKTTITTDKASIRPDLTKSINPTYSEKVVDSKSS